MNISLSDDLKQYIDRKVDEGAYTSASEYVRSLVRAEREVERQRGLDRLRELLLEGANSGPSPLSHEEIMAEARRIARGE